MQEKTEKIEAYEKDKTVSVPLETVKELIASAKEEAKKDAEETANQKIANYVEETKKAAAFARLAAVRTELKMKTDPADFKNRTAAEIEKDALDLEGLKTTAQTKTKEASPAQYPNTPTGGANTGIFNPMTGGWD